MYTVWSLQAQACPSAGKGAHRDRENRIFSLVIYLTDAEAAGWAGGELIMYAGDSAEAAKLSIVDTKVRPESNLGVLFLCSAHSIHRVADVHHCPPNGSLTQPSDAWRRVIYVSVARRVTSWATISRGPGLGNWPGPAPP